MIDEGAPVILIDDKILKELQIEGSSSNLSLQWFRNKTSTNSSQTVDLEISGVEKGADRLMLKNVRSVRNINLPIQSINIKNLPKSQQTIKRLPISEYRDAKPK